MRIASAPQYPAQLGAGPAWFPPVSQATADGLLAVGGDLSPERLLLGYSRGIFPWYSEGTPILWWSPNPRCILPLDEVHVPRRLERKIKQGVFRFTLNTAFSEVMRHCASSPRPGQSGTWLVPDMLRAYLRLHQLGFAHSVECWQGGIMVGGLYGVALGRAFFGESMFHRVSDASKASLLWLVGQLRERGFTLFDCQQETPHMLRLGARSVNRTEFVEKLQAALCHTAEDRGLPRLGGRLVWDPCQQAANFG